MHILPNSRSSVGSASELGRKVAKKKSAAACPDTAADRYEFVLVERQTLVLGSTIFRGLVGVARTPFPPPHYPKLVFDKALVDRDLLSG
jgi:hypothetical protein